MTTVREIELPPPTVHAAIRRALDRQAGESIALDAEGRPVLAEWLTLAARLAAECRKVEGARAMDVRHWRPDPDRWHAAWPAGGWRITVEGVDAAGRILGWVILWTGRGWAVLAVSCASAEESGR